MTELREDATEPAGLPEVLGANAVAAVFGTSARVADRWLAEGRLPSRKVGKRRFILRTDFMRALQPQPPGPRRAWEA